MPTIADILPAFASEKTVLYIIDPGQEVLARSLDSGVTWEKKAGRCDNCGNCCVVDIDGVPNRCPYLVETAPNNFVCQFSQNSPYQFGTPSDCVRGNGTGDNVGCSITFEAVP